MSDLHSGILKVNQKKGKTSIQVAVGSTLFSPATDQLSGNLAKQDGEEVEFERVGGQPKKVRPKGANFVPSSGSVTPSTAGDRSRGRDSGHRKVQHQNQVESRRAAAPRGDFHNPYNFIPAPPRNTSDQDLGDHQPVRHDCYLDGRYSGRIGVRLTVKTPLLVPDTDSVREGQNGHKTFPLRLDRNGLPLLASSGIRGMLRSAYEAITNSRFHNFPHRDRLAYRMAPRDGLQLIPARVASKDGNLHFELLTGTSKIGAQGPDGPQYAAWLPRYHRGEEDRQAPRCADGSLPRHSEQVQCWVERFRHSRWDRNRNQHIVDFQLWRVRSVALLSAPLERPQLSGSRPQQSGRSHYEPLGEIKEISGWVCVTNANINRKHDERVFFVDGQGRTLPCTEEHRKKWKELIHNYQALHDDEIERRRRREQRPDQYLGNEPGKTAWSRHVYTADDRELAEGTLCYVRLNHDRSAVEASFPVSISRKLYSVSPWDLLDTSHRPAESLEELSPADRVFGWVKARGTGAHKGFLRVGPVRCESSASEAVERFSEDGVPLAILAAPKPQLGAFYVARDNQGGSQPGLRKLAAGYKSGKGLRGRKVYPHQRSLPDDHWNRATEDRTQNGSGSHSQEYRRPRKDSREQRDDQNRSTQGWVKPGTTFRFDLDVTNLSEVELGGLLWLLGLPDDHFFRSGGGKPLGFGSIHLQVVQLDVRTPQQLRERYLSWSGDSAHLDPRPAAQEAFQQALVRAYDKPFESVPFVVAFLVACRGWRDDLPVHYPRLTQRPSPDGESFRWFVENERQQNPVALPTLTDDNGLPRH